VRKRVLETDEIQYLFITKRGIKMSEKLAAESWHQHCQNNNQNLKKKIARMGPKGESCDRVGGVGRPHAHSYY